MKNFPTNDFLPSSVRCSRRSGRPSKRDFRFRCLGKKPSPSQSAVSAAGAFADRERSNGRASSSVISNRPGGTGKSHPCKLPDGGDTDWCQELHLLASGQPIVIAQRGPSSPQLPNA